MYLCKSVICQALSGTGHRGVMPLVWASRHCRNTQYTVIASLLCYKSVSPGLSYIKSGPHLITLVSEVAGSIWKRKQLRELISSYHTEYDSLYCWSPGLHYLGFAHFGPDPSDWMVSSPWLASCSHSLRALSCGGIRASALLCSISVALAVPKTSPCA